MGFRRSRGSAKERDAPQTIYCTAVCLTSTRASECVAGDLDLRSLKRPYIALPAESTPEEIAAICGRNKVDRVILEITEEYGPATLGKRLKAAMLLRRKTGRSVSSCCWTTNAGRGCMTRQRTAWIEAWFPSCTSPTSRRRS